MVKVEIPNCSKCKGFGIIPVDAELAEICPKCLGSGNIAGVISKKTCIICAKAIPEHKSYCLKHTAEIVGRVLGFWYNENYLTACNTSLKLIRSFQDLHEYVKFRTGSLIISGKSGVGKSSFAAFAVGEWINTINNARNSVQFGTHRSILLELNQVKEDVKIFDKFVLPGFLIIDEFFNYTDITNPQKLNFQEVLIRRYAGGKKTLFLTNRSKKDIIYSLPLSEQRKIMDSCKTKHFIEIN